MTIKYTRRIFTEGFCISLIATPAIARRKLSQISGGGYEGGNNGDDEMPLISSGKINSPVDHVNIGLPTGYDLFELKLVGFKKDQFDQAILKGFFSQDAGSTFLSAYLSVDGGGGQSLIDHMVLGVLYETLTRFDEPVDYKGNSVSIIEIAPGSPSTAAIVVANLQSGDFDRDNGFGLQAQYTNRVNMPSLIGGRCNLLQLTLDNAPNFIAGSWFLRGELTPA